MFLESHLIPLVDLCANFVLFLITIALEQVLLSGGGCTPALLFVSDVILAILSPSIYF